MSSKFPELSSVATDDEEDLEYLITREEFEKKYPAKKARQATNKKAWPGVQKPTFTNTQPVEVPDNATGNEATAEAKDEKVSEHSDVTSDEKSLRSEFESKLDESQLKALEDIRARRERQRGK
jgi:hypothetical protein